MLSQYSFLIAADAAAAATAVVVVIVVLNIIKMNILCGRAVSLRITCHRGSTARHDRAYGYEIGNMRSMMVMKMMMVALNQCGRWLPSAVEERNATSRYRRKKIFWRIFILGRGKGQNEAIQEKEMLF